MSIITNQQIYDALKTQADAVSGNKMRTTDADVLAKLQAIEQRLNDPFLTQLTGRNVAEAKTQADAVADVITFSESIQVVEIYHDEPTVQTFIVNGLTLPVARGGWRSGVAGTPSADVTIPTGIDCVVSRCV